MKVQPAVVKEWNTEDGQNWSLTVDNGHYFSDGNEVTAYDVAYSLNVAVSNRFKSRLSGWVSSVYTDEDGLVIVELKKKNYSFPALLEVPVIQSETLYNSYPDRICSAMTARS
jgi:ABC-type transport system substrate-binding protein